MTKDLIISVGLCCWILLLAGCGQSGNESVVKTIRIAVAASAEPAISEIAQRYESENDLQIELIKGSSGKLYAQILNGSPIDLFISADTSFSGKLFRAGKSFPPPAPVAFGQLAMWTSNTATSDWKAALLDPALTRIAIANPQTAPFGKAARQLLEDSGLWQQTKTKVVFAESVGQIAMYIQQDAVDAAISSFSSSFILPEKKGHWIPLEEDSLQTQLPLGIARVKRGIATLETEAEKFLEVLLTESAQNTLVRHGFIPGKVSEN